MNIRQLQTLHAIGQLGSFAAAGDKLGLTHSAISIQMQQLEQTLGISLFDRGTKPATLTEPGIRISVITSEIIEKLDNIKQVASGAEVIDSITIGIIPTCVHFLLPRILSALQQTFPELQVKVKSGLSGELSTAIIHGDIDFALLSSPSVEIPELHITEIAREPFEVIAPPSTFGLKTDEDLVRSMPFISFNNRTWVGQHIAAKLQQRGIRIHNSLEIDSLEAIENLVANGFGVSIVPGRLHASSVNTHLFRVPFGNPVETRILVLAQHRNRPQSSLNQSIRHIFLELPKI
jgi:DNA-binding transcriptional LysR family regulator